MKQNSDQIMRSGMGILLEAEFRIQLITMVVSTPDQIMRTGMGILPEAEFRIQLITMVVSTPDFRS